MYLNNINEVVNDVKVTTGWSWCRRYYRKTSMYFLYVHLTFCLMLTPAKSCKALEPSFEWIPSCNCREEMREVTPCWLLNKEIAGAKKKKKKTVLRITGLEDTDKQRCLPGGWTEVSCSLSQSIVLCGLHLNSSREAVVSHLSARDFRHPLITVLPFNKLLCQSWGTCR